LVQTEDHARNRESFCLRAAGEIGCRGIPSTLREQKGGQSISLKRAFP
jgi:hypothetical protein